MRPTGFPELNAVLAALVGEAQEALAANFVGAYLQGSFALGDGDAFSDADFVIVTHEDIDEAAESRLGELHAALYDRPETWAQHIEGSYIPAGVLRSRVGAPREVPGRPRPPGWTDPAVAGRTATVYPLLFLGNGESEPVRSEHDNTEVMRWVLRERGIGLAGPPPRQLIDPVDPEALRAEVRDVMRSFGGTLLDGSVRLEALWIQGFTVLLFCRLLATLATGSVLSKPAAMAWVQSELDPRWTPLLLRAWEQRNRYVRGRNAAAANNGTPPPPDDVAETLAFVREALGRAGEIYRAGGPAL